MRARDAQDALNVQIVAVLPKAQYAVTSCE
jgi:hypothetical protein